MLSRIAAFLILACSAVAASQPATHALKRVLIADTEAKVRALSVNAADPTPVQVEDVPVLSGLDFRDVVRPFLGRPIDNTLVFGLGNAIAQYAKKHDRILTKVLMPTPQNISDGTLRIVVAVGHFSEVAFRGNRWFSSKLLQEQLGIQPGDEVRLSVLEDAINWANTNPFRQLKVILNQPANQPGKVDLLVGVQERLPWRLSASVDDYGNDVLGNRHYTGTIQAGNLWGLDHQVSYQYVTTDDTRVYQAHVFSYHIPLPWRHTLEASASYSKVQPTFGTANVFSQTGTNKTADLKYTIPIRYGDNPIEIHAGLDFKQGNNNLEFAGSNVYASNTDTFQFTTGGSLVQRDKRGVWVFGVNSAFSPGHLDAHNDTQTYQLARTGANPSYIYANVTAQRNQDLGHGWELQSRLTGQFSSANLIGGEELTIGGATTVRGYNTNVFAGDEGFIFGNDVLFPTLSAPLNKLSKKLPSLDSRFSVFYDAAQVFYKHEYGYPIDLPLAPLASTGVGLRMSMANNFSLVFDYGWQLTALPAIYHNQAHHRGHIKVVLAY